MEYINNSHIKCINHVLPPVNQPFNILATNPTTYFSPPCLYITICLHIRNVYAVPNIFATLTIKVAYIGSVASSADRTYFSINEIPETFPA